MDLTSESLRCLRIIAKDGAQLEEPFQTKAIDFLLAGRFIEVTSRYQANWNGKPHNVAKLAITVRGLNALQANAGSVR
jgi:hypothetical protein